MNANPSVEPYNATALHFDRHSLPESLYDCFGQAARSIADLGCGDGPWFAVLREKGLISPAREVYAVDLEPARLRRVSERFPWIRTIVAPADDVPAISDMSVEVVISTMVLEHVPDERQYLQEIARILGPGGFAFVTTVLKRRWAWYFRSRDGECVLDTSHLREYRDLGQIRSLVAGIESLCIESIGLHQLWFPLADPVLFRVGHLVRLPALFVRAVRLLKVPIPGYYEVVLVLRKNA